MRTLLILATATTILTTAAHRPATPVDRHVATSQGVGPDLVRDAVRRAVGFDRLTLHLARGR